MSTIAAIIFLLISCGIVVYCIFEMKASNKIIKTKFYLSLIPWIGLIIFFAWFLLTTNQEKILIIEQLARLLSHKVIQNLLIDAFLICGIHYFLTSKRR